MIKERIQLIGDFKEKIEQILKYAGWYIGRNVDIESVIKYYQKHGLIMLQSIQDFYHEYFQLCCSWYLEQKELEWAADFEFGLFPYLINGVETYEVDDYFEDMLGEDLVEIEEFASQKCQPLGIIGYQYPAQVWMSEDGNIYTKYEYQDEIEVFSNLFSLIEYELKGCKLDSIIMKTIEKLDG